MVLHYFSLPEEVEEVVDVESFYVVDWARETVKGYDDAAAVGIVLAESTQSL